MHSAFSIPYLLLGNRGVLIFPNGNSKKYKKTTTLLGSRFKCWRFSIVPGRHQPSIVDINELNFCVRDGNRWTLVIINTNYFVLPSFLTASL